LNWACYFRIYRFKSLTVLKTWKSGDNFSAESKASSTLDLFQRFGQHFPIRSITRRRLFRHFWRSRTTPVLHANNFPECLCNPGHLFLLQGTLAKPWTGFEGSEVGGGHGVLVGQPLGPNVTWSWAANWRLRNIASILSTLLVSSFEIWFCLKIWYLLDSNNCTSGPRYYSLRYT